MRDCTIRSFPPAPQARELSAQGLRLVRILMHGCLTLGAVVLRAALNTYQLWREHKTRRLQASYDTCQPLLST